MHAQTKRPQYINTHEIYHLMNSYICAAVGWLDWMKETDRIMPYLICRQSMALKFMCTMRANNAPIQHSTAVGYDFVAVEN